MVQHKDAMHIHLVLDNLNTHREQSLRQEFGEKKAQKFFARVTLHFTPKHASWLNMAELEINCLKAQGVKGRMKDADTLCKAVAAAVTERNTRRAKIAWGFTQEKAKQRFPGLYSRN